MAKVAALEHNSTDPHLNPASLREAADPKARPSKLSSCSPDGATSTGISRILSNSLDNPGNAAGKRPAANRPGCTPTSPTSPSAARATAAKSHGCRYWLRLVCQRVCENKKFLLFGTIVTIWALIGDDLRLGCTDRPADPVFNGLVVFCIVFFTLEIFLCCMGQDDYFMGFFFGLDLISTATLVLDLSVVSDLMTGGGDGGADDARASRTARLGAKVGRVVRVLRLIRIVKLYKAFYTGTSKKLKRGMTMAGDDADLDETDDFDKAEERGAPGKESLVGKKLSAKTTQRTILMVLTMLIVLPLLTISASLRTPASATMGADDVWQAFNKMLVANSSNEAMLRSAYEDVLLKYVYYHNWFAPDECPRDAACSKWYYSQNFWVGLGGNADMATLNDHAVSARLSSNKVRKFQSDAETQNDLFNYGTMPSSVLEILEGPWDTECTVSGIKHLGFSVLAKSNTDKVEHVVRCPDDVRPMEREKYTPRLLTRGQYEDWHFAFFFDLRPFTREEAARSICTTFFVCVVLCVASLFFSNDANTLVLQPVEQMITKVEAIRDNPLIAMKMADEEFREVMKSKSMKMETKSGWNLERIKRMCGLRKEKQELMETVILEKTIIKLGSLLALGFGEAGANIVSHNMRGSSSAGVNAMVSGSRVDCILGNARIRDFSTFTVVLQGAVMTFVNQVAEIVHGIVDEYQGAVNKNNGDTFLIIWRCADRPRAEVTKLAEMSLLAFSTILGCVHRSPVLSMYRTHPGLQQRLSQCRVNLSFGLHYGWAIEGAVGSEFKIDASYLSQNVNISASLEHATRVYNVSLIASQGLVELCTWGMSSYMRLIDKVVIKGSKEPMGIYSLDLDFRSLEVDVLGWTDGGCCQPIVWNSHQRYRARQILEADKRRIWDHTFDIADVFATSEDIAVMRTKYTDQFRHVFNMGYQNYSQGEWSVAQQLLMRAQDMLGAKDGPSGALLQFMEVPHQFQAPEGWQGVHSLTLESS